MFHRIIGVAVFLQVGTAWASESAALVAPSVSLPPGTAVRLRLNESLSSRDAHTGDRVTFKVDQDLDVDGHVAIPKGSLAWGSISDATPAGRMARSGRLSIGIQSVCLADGKSAELRGTDPNASSKRRNKSEYGNETAFAVPAWPILMFMTGKEVNVAAGTEITAYIDAPVHLRVAALKEGPATSCNDKLEKPLKTASLSETVANIRSDPDRAEIQIDHQYAGNTPSRIGLTPGEHTISVNMPGRQSWERKLVVEPGGELTIFAPLEPAKAIQGSRDATN
ncbi:MAG TPA: PEGA domain-containing protein [Bryobacteraceae bacterium]|nr:PEGA domain-containing protein [Bryobacteraceae bacterium]